MARFAPMRRVVALCRGVVVAWLSLPVTLAAQAGAATDVIVGRVIDAATGAPIDHASVSATSLANGRVRTAQSSADGHYLLVFADGGGRYVISARRLGYAMASLTVARRAESDRINIDITLSITATLLERVVVTPDSSSASAGTGRTVSQERVSRLPLDNAGDLAAIAALIPGVVSTSATDTTTASFSVAGQRATQNHISLDGLT